MVSTDAGSAVRRRQGRTQEKFPRTAGIWYDYPNIWHERKKNKMTLRVVD